MYLITKSIVRIMADVGSGSSCTRLFQKLDTCPMSYIFSL